MFNKTKRRIFFTVVFSLLALMLVTLATIYVSNRIALQRENEEMLRTFAERYSLNEQPEPRVDGKPDGRPEERPGGLGPRNGEPDKNEPRFQLSTFYSVAFSTDGEVLAVNSGNDALHSEESLTETAASILKGSSKSGSRGGLAYLVEERGDYTLVAMIDSTINDSNQSLLFRQMLVIGTAALIILAAVSFFLARRIVRPLEENDERQKRFVSDAGHELKTPIAVISANSELLRRDVGENEWLSNIDYENERMSELVKQLLSLSRAETAETVREPLDFSKLAAGEVLPFESLAYEKGKKILSTIEPGITVKGNRTQLKQLVSILLDNALSHGTGEETELSLRREKHSAVLTVSNEARLDGEKLSRLFDRFYRADEARSESGSHYGLGLPIAKAVTEAHGGSIHAACRDGKAVFTVTLPIEKT